MNYGIICEFNPFHKGHKHLIDTIKSENNNVICVMSGNFVQRGEFAVYNKFERAKTAIENGADLVIELPCSYSLMSAQGFAQNAVRILEATNCTDALAFGAECNDIERLKSIADEIKSRDGKIKEELKKGISYPAARKNIIKSDILDKPNNILAIEYISSTKLPCKAVKRVGMGHDSEDINYSASAIRNTLSPETICTLNNCERAVLAKLRVMKKDDFLQIEDVSEGLENRLVNAVKTASTLEEIYDNAKTKRYTHSRIRRIILKAYLGITRDFAFDAPYIRILGFNSRGKEILSRMKKTAYLPIISRYADIKKADENSQRLFELECRCTDLYNLGYKNILPCSTEQTSKIVIV
ncbi:MAG: nucleotidyltransferase family protein [Acetobacter sp.]|nr:nucleotidyltransferase family protein [Bacteroides sp.]MCM1341382.1 nucleotidyltransferase family protein [Acetobacter sp.]MCM1433475.1 nucleotidyltransferase family protein [Clostridiales bacterium]